MIDNPLEDSPERDARIRERAYHLWQADGGPHGSDLEYWERARELVAIEDSAGAEQLRSPMLSNTVEEAAIQENYGEFPDRLADQGERRATPMTRSEMRKTAQAK